MASSKGLRLRRGSWPWQARRSNERDRPGARTPALEVRSRRRILIVAAMLAAFVVAGFAFAAGEQIAPGVAAFGTPLGGLNRSQAAERLGPWVEAFLSRPMQLQYQDRVWSTTARELGLRADPGQLADSAYRVGRAGTAPARLGQWVGGRAAGQKHLA